MYENVEGAKGKIEDHHFPKVLWFQVNVKSFAPIN